MTVNTRPLQKVCAVRSWTAAIGLAALVVCIFSPAFAETFTQVRKSPKEQAYAVEKDGIKLFVSCGAESRIEIRQDDKPINGNVKILSKRFQYEFEIKQGLYKVSNETSTDEFDQFVRNIRWMQYWILEISSDNKVEFYAPSMHEFSEFCKFVRKPVSLTEEEVREIQESLKSFAGTGYRGRPLVVYREPIDGKATREFLSLLQDFASMQGLPDGKNASMEDILAHIRSMRSDQQYMSKARVSLWRFTEKNFRGVKWRHEGNWKGSVKVSASGSSGGYLAFSCVYAVQSGARPKIERLSFMVSRSKQAFSRRPVTLQVDDLEPIDLPGEEVSVTTTANAALFERIVNQLSHGKVAEVRTHSGHVSRIELEGGHENLGPCLNPVYDYKLIDDAQLAEIVAREKKSVRLEVTTKGIPGSYGSVSICNAGRNTLRFDGLHAYVNRAEQLKPVQITFARSGVIEPETCEVGYGGLLPEEVVGFNFLRLSDDGNTWYYPSFSIDQGDLPQPKKRFSNICSDEFGTATMTYKMLGNSIDVLPETVPCVEPASPIPVHINLQSYGRDLTLNVN